MLPARCAFIAEGVSSLDSILHSIKRNAAPTLHVMAIFMASCIKYKVVLSHETANHALLDRNAAPPPPAAMTRSRPHFIPVIFRLHFNFQMRYQGNLGNNRRPQCDLPQSLSYWPSFWPSPPSFWRKVSRMPNARPGSAGPIGIGAAFPPVRRRAITRRRRPPRRRPGPTAATGDIRTASCIAAAFTPANTSATVTMSGVPTVGNKNSGKSCPSERMMAREAGGSVKRPIFIDRRSFVQPSLFCSVRRAAAAVAGCPPPCGCYPNVVPRRSTMAGPCCTSA